MAKHRRKGVRPGDVIEGKTRPGPRALVSLIAAVNPTDRGLSPAEQARRYAEKSALQSSLLRWYGDAFFAEPTEDADIVLLRHRRFDECACHARVSSLDEAARRWVWHNLDDGSPEEPGPSSPRDDRRGAALEGSAPDLLARAHAALAAYDYELAERLLVASFEQTAGEPSAARALLELFVDVLGRVAEALALEPRLSAEARVDPPVRSLLGLAAARAGDAARALVIARDLEHPRAGEVFAEAGRAALRSGDVEAARRSAMRARELGAAPEAASLEAAIEEALRARASSREAELEALVQGGDEERAEALARAMLSDELPSALAKRVLRESSARRAEEAARALTGEARAALDAGEWARARSALDELARLGRRDAELEACLASAEQALAEARDARLVAATVDALTREPLEGLARYLELPDALRARVRAEGAAPLCELADAVREALGRRRTDEVVAAVEQVRALERALDAGELDAAVALTEALPRGVDTVPLVRQLADEVRSRRASEAKAQVDAAWDALMEGDWETAIQRARAIPPSSAALLLDKRRAPAGLVQIAELAQKLEARVRAAREPGADLVTLLSGSRAAGSLSYLFGDDPDEDDPDGDDPDEGEPDGGELDAGGRDEPAPAVDPQRWACERDELAQLANEALRFEEHAVPEGTLVDLEDEQELGAHAPDARIDREGKIWLIASPEERCYVTEAAPRSLEVRRRFSFSVGGVRRGVAVLPVGDDLFVPLSDGGMVVLDRKTPSTLRAVWWGPKSKKGAVVHDAWATVAPDARAAVHQRLGSNEEAPQLRCLATGTTRSLTDCASVCFFGHGGRARLLVTGDRRRAWYVLATDLTHIGGAERFKGELADLVPIAAIDDPAADDEQGGHILLAVDASTLDGDRDHAPRRGVLYLVRVTADLCPIAHVRLSDEPTSLNAWLYRLADDVLVVTHASGFPTFERFDGASFEKVGSITGITGMIVPVQSSDGRITLFLERGHHGFRAPGEPTLLTDEPSEAESVSFCSGLLSPRGACAQSADAWARPLFAKQLEPRLLQAAVAREGRARLSTIANASRFIASFTEEILERTNAEIVLKILWRSVEPSPPHPFFRGAEHAVVLCPEDPEVIPRLEAAVDANEDLHWKGHALHLLGLAHLAAGRREAALAAWRAGEASPGHHCPFRLLIPILGGMDEEERAEFVRRLCLPSFVLRHADRYEEAVAAMAELDQALEAGRGSEGWALARRARAAVGPSWQLSARVAQLHLDHPEPGADPWRIQLDLVWMASGAWLGHTRNHMIFAGSHWDYRRMDAITRRAAAAIDAMGIGPAERVTSDDVEAPADAQPEDENGD